MNLHLPNCCFAKTVITIRKQVVYSSFLLFFDSTQPNSDGPTGPPYVPEKHTSRQFSTAKRLANMDHSDDLACLPSRSCSCFVFSNTPKGNFISQWEAHSVFVSSFL